jgi:hypothetical protein
MPSPKKQSEKNNEEKSYNRANNYDHPKQNRNRKPHEIPRLPARSKPLSLQALTHKTRKKQERDLHQEFPESGNAPTASQRRDMHAYMRRWECRCVYVCVRKVPQVPVLSACTRDLLDSQPFTIAVQLQVQVGAGHMAKSPGNRRAVSSCSKAFASTYPRAVQSRQFLFSNAVNRAYHILSQPLSLLLAAQPAALHTALSRDLSATADLALPVSLALPRLPACLSHLLAFSPDFSPGSKNRKSEVPKY